MLRIFLFAVAVLLSGCGSDVDSAAYDEKPGAFVRFDSESGAIPYPNNILFAGAQDGTLNIPYEATDADAALTVQLNTLDGFSTASSITVPLSAPIDAATLAGNVHVFKVQAIAAPQTLYIPGVIATERALTYGQDFVLAATDTAIAIVPTSPMEGHSNYMVVVTDGVRAANGGLLAPDATTAMLMGTHALVDENGTPTVYLDPDTTANTYAAAQLEGLRQLNALMIAQAEKAGIARENIVTVWSFQTQTIGAVNANLAAAAMAHPTAALSLANTGINTKTVLASFGYDTTLLNGSAQIYAGTLASVPQYMPYGSAEDPSVVTGGSFRYSAPFKPALEYNATLPVVATVPNAASGCTEPESGWPVVLFQHGIGRDRTDLFGFGETLALGCRVGIAIDLPLHGVTETNTSINPFYAGALERTFNVDLVTENPYGTVIAYAPDGIIDSSGANFMNFTHVITTRDNLRQTTSDLTVLTQSIGNAVGITLDQSRISFLAYSLGTIASAGYIQHATMLESAVLLMPGQQIIPFLLASPYFSPQINAGLAAIAGLMPDTPEYDAFALASQTLIDDADPVNYSKGLAASSVFPVLMFQALHDQHILATVDTAPLAGTEPFIRFSAAHDINTSRLKNVGIGYLYATEANRTVSRINQGDHTTALDPSTGFSAFVEYQSELISFIDSKGASIFVIDPALLGE